MNTIQISVSIEGNEVWRNYAVDSYDDITEDTYGKEIVDMVESLRNAQKNEDFFRDAKVGAI